MARCWAKKSLGDWVTIPVDTGIGAWDAFDMTNTSKYFTGDFEFVAMRSHIDCGPVAEYPTQEQVTLAQMRMADFDDSTWEAAGHAYYIEKTKSRYCRDGATEREILSRVGSRLAKLALEAR